MTSPRSRWRAVGALGVGALLSLTVACTAGSPPSAAPSSPASSPATSTEAPWAWVRADPAAAGFDGRRLQRLAAEAEQAGSTCLAVVREGRLVGEWNWRGTTAGTPREVFSVTKSVTSTLVGLAQADGDLSLEDRASSYVPQWRGTPSAEVTVRQLLANDSGREWSPDIDYGTLLRAQDRTGLAVGLGQDAAPGRVWAYNNAAIQTLDAVLRAATGQDTATYAAQRLFGPLGMADTRMTPDASGRSTNAFFGVQSTCLDLARLGLLFAQRGQWEGERLLPASWVDDAVGAPSQRLNAAYGLLWWLNRRGPIRQPLDESDRTAPPSVSRVGRLAPDAPADTFAAQGLGGQVVLVDPGSQTVVVRLGEAQLGGPTPYSFADAARVVTWALRSAR